MRNLLVTSLVVLALPGTALGGTFDVYTTGCPSGWKAQTFAHGKLLQEDRCSSWRIWSTAPLEQGDFAAMSMYAGEGAQFTGFSIRSSGFTNNGVTWSMAMCRTAFADCTNHVPRSGSMAPEDRALGTAVPGGGPLYSTHIYAGVSCSQPTCAHPGADVTHTDAHVIVDDFTAPGSPTLSGISSGWNSGTLQVGYTASDAGSGIEEAELVTDDAPFPDKSAEHSCLRLPGGFYTHPIPCATATSGQFELDTELLGDGRHSLAVAVRDAGGNVGTARQEFLVDNTAPDPPDAAKVAGGDGWHSDNGFAVSWENPGPDGGSPITGAYYRIGSAPQHATDGSFVAGADATSLSSIQVPGDGAWPLYVWLQDEAGNADPPTAPVAELRLDTTSPSLAFAGDRDAANPAEVRVTAADAASGVAGGTIEIRRRGGTDWRTLETRLDGAHLVASVPDHELPRGAYELRATGWDAAGNIGSTTSRADGAPMVLELPLRRATRLSATLARRPGGAVRAARRMRVPYGSVAWLRGSLRSGARALPHTRLIVTARRLTGGGRRWQAAVSTDAQGRYAIRLPRGPSREVHVHFPGSASRQPATTRARLFVRGWASLTLQPSSLRRGGTIAFVGRVGHRGAKLPPAGKLVQIQFLDGRRWRPAVKLAHAGRRGRFTIRYRFRRISRPTLIYFRILVPAEGGWPYATGWSPVRVAHVRP